MMRRSEGCQVFGKSNKVGKIRIGGWAAVFATGWDRVDHDARGDGWLHLPTVNTQSLVSLVLVHAPVRLLLKQ
jgi:hypothetical protein